MNNKINTIIAILLASTILFACKSKKVATTKVIEPVKTTKLLNSFNDTLSYALGLSVGKSLEKQGFENLNLKTFDFGMKAASLGSEQMLTDDEMTQILTSYSKKLVEIRKKKKEKENAAFFLANSQKEGITTLPSGLQYQVLKVGTGAKPLPSDKVTTHYTGKLLNGKVFDSSVQRGQPSTFPVTGVIKGWVEALQLMPTGSKWKLYIPSHLAYGERGAGRDIGPNEALIFDIELIKIN